MVTTMRDAIIAPHLLLQTFYARKENVSQLRSIKYHKTVLVHLFAKYSYLLQIERLSTQSSLLLYKVSKFTILSIKI